MSSEFEGGLSLGMMSSEEQAKFAFIVQSAKAIGGLSGKTLGSAFGFAKKNPVTTLTAAFAVPGAVTAGQRVTKSMGTGLTEGGSAIRKSLTDPVTKSGPMGSIF